MKEPLRSIDPNLLKLDQGRLELRAGRNRSTGRIVYPWQSESADCDEIVLPREGRLWSWTVQRFRPKSPPYAGPVDFEPFAVGYVDLGEIIVEARLTGAPLDAYRIGMPMVLVAERFTPVNDSPCTTFAFAPTGDPL